MKKRKRQKPFENKELDIDKINKEYENLNYAWQLKKDYPKANDLKVFGTFVCGGGSTMGYKLEGFNHLGGVEIDKRMAELYNINHKPKYLYLEDIREFNKREDLPKELYELDILDGSPPCSTFSMAGKREQNWGRKRGLKKDRRNKSWITWYMCTVIPLPSYSQKWLFSKMFLV